MSDVVVTHDSCYVVSGLVGDASTDTFYPLLMKLNDQGDTLWTRTFDFDTPIAGTPGDGFDQSSQVIKMKDSPIFTSQWAYKEKATLCIRVKVIIDFSRFCP